MSVEFQKVAVVGRHDDSRVAEPMKILVEHLAKTGVVVLAAEEMALDLPVERVSATQLADNADLVIAIGGDGTMLYAGSLVRDSGVPLFGIKQARFSCRRDSGRYDLQRRSRPGRRIHD